eukprot:m.196223 g.196223  ORF g.196223 m.196223 type:complete len:1583 (+) comp14904_c0_seq2:235-4983(+)
MLPGKKMACRWVHVLCLLGCLAGFGACVSRRHQAGDYHHSWAVHVPDHDLDKVDELAKELGYINRGKVGALDGFYHFEHECIAEDPHCIPRDKHSFNHTQRLLAHPHIKWAEQQKVLRRERRAPITPDDNKKVEVNNPGLGLELSPQQQQQHEKVGPSARMRRSVDQAIYAKSIKDPRFSQQWHLYQANGFHHNVIPVWDSGITGKGVVVTVVDDGIEHTHSDLKDNYDAQASIDLNGDDDDAMPDESNPINKHGTRCCGEIAAARNTACGVGVAYEAGIGGIRMLDGPVSDIVEGKSLSHNPQHVDIYSNSWGPNDDGHTVEGPGPLATKAIKDGVDKGRNGKGSIIVFASGNGGRSSDNCNCDGYTNSMYTISIGAADEKGNSPWYTEKCASTIAVAYSSGSSGARSITTVDLHNGCTSSHTGTSAAAPIAAGILALVLQANPKLTWRDVQHVVIRSAIKTAPSDSDWSKNRAGLNINHKFGFGLMDADKTVAMAKSWVPIGPQLTYKTPLRSKSVPFRVASSWDTAVEVTETLSAKDTGIRRLEHIQLKVDISATSRGDVAIHLYGPTGTYSDILSKRPSDYTSAGLKWTFMTVRHWDENPIGTWTLKLRTFSSTGNYVLNSWSLIFYGTATAASGSCAVGTFVDDTGACVNCHTQCGDLGCSGPTASECNNCHLYSNLGTCIGDCRDVDKLNPAVAAASQECVACHSECKDGCFGASNTQCVACAHLELDAGDHKTCLAACPTMFFAQTSNSTCLPCHEQCGTGCTGPTASDCTDCASVQLPSGECAAECPITTYLDHSTMQCTPCDAECAPEEGCHGPSSTSCNACAHFSVQVVTPRITAIECVETCPPSRQPDSNNATCVCASGTYPDHITMDCLPCDTACETGCVGPAVTDCVGNCTSLQHLDECVSECPEHWFASADAQRWSTLYPHHTLQAPKVCLPCNNLCVGACTEEGPDACVPNADGRRCTGLERDGVCVDVCPSNTYEDRDTMQCMECAEVCEACTGPTSAECLTCRTLEQQGTCVTECSTGFFESNGVCIPCNEECDGVCFGPASTQCFESTDAAAGDAAPRCKHVHANGQCLAACPTSFFQEGGAQECVPCHAECSTAGCTGALSTECKGCKHFLDAVSKECVRACGLGEFADLSSMQCIKCDPSCGTEGCHQAGPSGCVGSEPVTCEPGFVPEAGTCVPDVCDTVTLNGTCVPSCPSGMFEDTSATCQPCTPNCHACTGPTANDCTECSGVWLVPNGEAKQKQCLAADVCPDDYFLDGDTCVACDAECEQCFGPTAKDCKVCRHVSFRGTCIGSCETGYYEKQASPPYCAQCHVECSGGCRDGTASTCAECAHFELNGSCVSKCPAGTYGSADTGKCTACHSECVKGCTGPEASDCVGDACADFDLNGICVAACPDNMYADQHAHTCVPCDTSCKDGCISSPTDCKQPLDLTSTATTTSTASTPAPPTTKAGEATHDPKTTPRDGPTSPASENGDSTSPMTTTRAELILAIAFLVCMFVGAVVIFTNRKKQTVQVQYKTLDMGSVDVMQKFDLDEEDDDEGDSDEFETLFDGLPPEHVPRQQSTAL